ncbi:MAG: SMC-Scp complex subunit ScpB, partial [Planctomycetota bacterium]
MTTEGSAGSAPEEFPEALSEESDEAADELADESDESGEVETAGEAVMDAQVEAVLFASDSVLNAAKIGKVVAAASKRSIAAAVDRLNSRYDERGSAFRIENIAGGYQMLTRPEYQEVVRHLYHQKADTKLTQAAIETLAIVAYRQPIIRADIESIRGVACGEVLRGLMERQLVKIVGRAELLGRPMLYGTTRRFLEVFGLNSIEDLPNAEELRAAAPKKQTKPEQASLFIQEEPTEGPGQGTENQEQ